jgi:AcrR family transcriptional regulator
VARRDTRELILATALALYNELGEPNVSTNAIAIEADISPGNLHYHFRHKDEIALELFKRYLLALQPLLEVDESAPPSLEELHLRLHLVFEAQARYRFLFRDLADLYARIDNLRRAMRGLLGRQSRLLSNLLQRLEKAGMLRIDTTAAELLVENILLIMTYWIPHAAVLDEEGLDDGSAVARAVAQVLYLLVPYLGAEEGAELEQVAAEYLS